MLLSALWAFSMHFPQAALALTGEAIPFRPFGPHRMESHILEFDECANEPTTVRGDIRDDAEQPRLKVYCRQPDAWEVLDFGSDAVYRTDLLPGFELPVTPPAE